MSKLNIIIMITLLIITLANITASPQNEIITINGEIKDVNGNLCSACLFYIKTVKPYKLNFSNGLFNISIEKNSKIVFYIRNNGTLYTVNYHANTSKNITIFLAKIKISNKPGKVISSNKVAIAGQFLGNYIDEEKITIKMIHRSNLSQYTAEISENGTFTCTLDIPQNIYGKYTLIIYLNYSSENIIITSNVYNITFYKKKKYKIFLNEPGEFLINGYITPPEENIPITLQYSFDQKTWHNFTTTSTDNIGNFTFNITELANFPEVYLRAIIPETSEICNQSSSYITLTKEAIVTSIMQKMNEQLINISNMQNSSLNNINEALSRIEYMKNDIKKNRLFLYIMLIFILISIPLLIFFVQWKLPSRDLFKDNIDTMSRINNEFNKTLEKLNKNISQIEIVSKELPMEINTISRISKEIVENMNKMSRTSLELDNRINTLLQSINSIRTKIGYNTNMIEQILDRNKSTINDLIYIKKTGNEIKYSLSQLESLSQTIKNMNTEIINNINQSFEKYSNKNIAHIRDVFKENLNIINEHLFSIEEMRRKMTLQINMLEKLIKNNISKTEEIYKISIRGIEKKVQKLEKEINDKIKEIDKEIDRLRKEQINVYFYNLINDEIKKRAKEISTLKIQEKLAALYEVYSLISLLEKVINDPEVYYRCRALYRIGLID